MKGDGPRLSDSGLLHTICFYSEYVALCVKMKWLFLAFYVLLSVLILIAYKGLFGSQILLKDLEYNESMYSRSFVLYI